MGVGSRCTAGAGPSAGPPVGDSPPGRNGAAQGADPDGVGGQAGFGSTAGTAPESCGPGAARGSAVGVPAGETHADGGKGTITGLEKSSKKSKVS